MIKSKHLLPLIIGSRPQTAYILEHHRVLTPLSPMNRKNKESFNSSRINAASSIVSLQRIRRSVSKIFILVGFSISIYSIYHPKIHRFLLPLPSPSVLIYLFPRPSRLLGGFNEIFFPLICLIIIWIFKESVPLFYMTVRKIF